MSQVGLKDKVIFMLDMRQKLLVILTNILGRFLYIPIEEEVELFTKNFLAVVSGALDYTPLRKPDDIEWISVSLDEWKKSIQEYWKLDKLPDGFLGIDAELKHLTIWEDKDRSYWATPLTSLLVWLSYTHAHLISSAWQASARYIELVVTMAHEKAEVLGVGGDRAGISNFWIVNIGSEAEAMNGFADALNIELLVAQLVARQGGGSLEIEVIGEEQISMVLKIPRADVISRYELEQDVLPWAVAEAMLNRVILMTADAWLRMGNCLSERLAVEKMQQLKSSVTEEQMVAWGAVLMKKFDLKLEPPVTKEEVVAAIGDVEKYQEKLGSTLQNLAETAVQWRAK